LAIEYRITITEDAEVQFLALPVRDQRTLRTAIRSRLAHQPKSLTHAVKRLRQNPVAEFELRAGDFRVLYNVEVDEVIVVIVARKIGNKLIVAGEEFRGHQDHPPEAPGSGPEREVE
jgi:mRNA-degrading endonuclease RelE of RelBE toxin-antitoxin system